MKRKIIRYFILSLGGILLASCDKSEQLEEKMPLHEKEMVTVTFEPPVFSENSAVSDVKTRAALENNVTVRIVAYKSGAASPLRENYVRDVSYVVRNGTLQPCTVKDDGSFNTLDENTKMELLSGKYDFYAYTPAFPLNEDKITVNVQRSDYATSVTAAQDISGDNNTLNLNKLSRKCAKITLKLEAPDGYRGEFNYVVQLAPLSPFPQEQVDVQNNVVLNEDLSMRTLSGGYSISAPPGGQSKDYIIFPEWVNNLKIFTRVTIINNSSQEKKEVDVFKTLPGEYEFQAGRYYVLTLRITESELEPKFELLITVYKNWDEVTVPNTVGG